MLFDIRFALMLLEINILKITITLYIYIYIYYKFEYFEQSEDFNIRRKLKLLNIFIPLFSLFTFSLIIFNK